MSLDLDKEGFLVDLDAWSKDIAQALAVADDIQLEAAHWEVIEVLREFYGETDVAPSMRPFVKLVRKRLGPDKGNSIYLMELFGASPAKTAAKCSGLPRPTNCL